MKILKNILKEVRTPFYLYDRRVLLRQFDKLHQNKPENLRIFYAMKGNSSLEILRFFNDMNMGVEIASGGELFLANHVGFHPGNIIYTGPGKTDHELKDAVEKGIKSIHIESLQEAKRLNAICTKLGTKQDILIRINANYEVKTKVQLSGIPGPFGISEEELEFILPKILKLGNLHFKGIHVYNASGILEHELLLQNIENVFKLVNQLEDRYEIRVKQIDFGGGLGIDYSDEDRHVDVEAFYNGMKKLINEYQFENRELIMEIARYLLAESGYYVTRIIDKKRSRGETFLITDGGIQHFMRTTLFGENHSASIFQNNANNETEEVNVTGNLCTSIDVLFKNACLPKAEIGDYFVIKKAGCYSLNAAINHFLSHEMPAEIITDGKDYKIIRNRGKHEDLLINQI